MVQKKIHLFGMKLIALMEVGIVIIDDFIDYQVVVLKMIFSFGVRTEDGL